MLKKITSVTGLLCLVIPIAVVAQADLQCNNENAAILATTAHLQDNGDGTVSDAKTGLVWKKCSEGQSWNAASNSCDSSAVTYNWQGALQQAQDVNAGLAGENLGKTDWRVPNIKELASIVEQKCWSPAINVFVFPSTPSSSYWSSSPVAFGSNFAWYVYFGYGNDNASYKNDNGYVRLVRSGQ